MLYLIQRCFQCTLEKKLVKKVNPETSCRKVGSAQSTNLEMTQNISMTKKFPCKLYFLCTCRKIFAFNLIDKYLNVVKIVFLVQVPRDICAPSNCVFKNTEKVPSFMNH